MESGEALFDPACGLLANEFDWRVPGGFLCPVIDPISRESARSWGVGGLSTACVRCELREFLDYTVVPLRKGKGRRKRGRIVS
jgi:hypothetical protein